jgi:hypothetical protein
VDQVELVVPVASAEHVTAAPLRAIE